MFQAESKAQETHSEFENVTRLIKSELARFEQERVEDFKVSLETFLEGMIARQNEVNLPPVLFSLWSTEFLLLAVDD